MKKIILILFLNVIFLFGCSKSESPENPAPACEKVAFPDANLEMEIRVVLNKPTGDICRSDCEKITTLELYGKNITNIEGLQYFKNLTYLDLSDNQITVISVLGGLTKLIYLGLSYNNISDISALSGLTELNDLNLENNNITDISALSSLTKLIGLTLSNNSISDLTPLENLLDLQYIYLSDNNIEYITVLVNNCNLGGLGAGDYVYLDGNPLTYAASDISYLEGQGVSVVY